MKSTHFMNRPSVMLPCRWWGHHSSTPWNVIQQVQQPNSQLKMKIQVNIYGQRRISMASFTFFPNKPCPKKRKTEKNKCQINITDVTKTILYMYHSYWEAIASHFSLFPDNARFLFPAVWNTTCVFSGLNQWDDIEKLNFFPKLEEVRLQGIPLLQTYTNAERRSLIIAQWVCFVCS